MKQGSLKQSSLLFFGRLVPGFSADRSQGQAAAAAAQADGPGLPLGGLSPARKPGRPSKQQLYEDMLVDALRCGRIDEVQLVETSYAPEWWRPGMGLLVEAPAEAFLAAHECVPEPDVMEEALARRRGEEAPLTGEDIAAQRRGARRCLLAHGLLVVSGGFGGVHPDTFRRWPPQRHCSWCLLRWSHTWSLAAQIERTAQRSRDPGRPQEGDGIFGCHFLCL